MPESQSAPERSLPPSDQDADGGVPADGRFEESSEAALIPVREALTGFIKLLNVLISACGEGSWTSAELTRGIDVPPPCNTVVALLLQAQGASSDTLLVLSRRGALKARDCFAVVRSVVELAVNTCYIIALGPAAAERALRHAKQKQFRNLTRSSTFGSTKIEVHGPTLKGTVPAELESAVVEFTSARGREKPWIDLSVDQRILRVEELRPRAAQALHWAGFGVYGMASEVLHGSLYSVSEFFGVPHTRTGDQVRRHVAGELELVLVSASAAALAVIEAFDAAYGFPEMQTLANEFWSEMVAKPSRTLGEGDDQTSRHSSD